MATTLGGLSDDRLHRSRSLFMPGMTVQAMRDSRYRHPANAVAELIDNAIDAEATRIEVLIQERQEMGRSRKLWRVNKLAVLDNGYGMSPDTLVQALRFGGRLQTGSMRKIGKYGMGLPTSSVSQCRRLDVWTWETDIESASHSYIDVDEINEGSQLLIPDSELRLLPTDWLSLASPNMVDKQSGTLVVWSNPDRITQRSETIFDQIEEEIGRIYRHFINSDDLAIRMASFRPSGQDGFLPPGPRFDRIVRPNDPLYLMKETSVPLAEGMPDPMFHESTKKDFVFDVDGREEIVEVVYSIARPEILGEYKGTQPGNRPYGRHARKNMGISVVREDREISLENYFIREGGGGSIPENRWWGCEVRFNSGCDDLFGVDHNKQLVSHFATAMKYVDGSDKETRQIQMDLGEDAEDSIYKVVAHIRNTTRSMMREIEGMFSRRPRSGRAGPDGGEATTPKGQAEDILREATRASIESGKIKPNKTDIDREELSQSQKIRAIEAIHQDAGIPEDEARSIAEKVVRDDKWYNIIPAELDGYQMFSFVSKGGILTMKLNISHPIYRFIQGIEDAAEGNGDGNELAKWTAIGLLAMLLSWGRMEDDIERDDVRIQVQDRARAWGQMVDHVLNQIDVDTQTGDE